MAPVSVLSLASGRLFASKSVKSGYFQCIEDGSTADTLIVN